MQECGREARKGQGEQSAPETAPMRNIPLPETGRGKGMCSEGEKGASGLNVHLICELLRPFLGPGGLLKKKKKVLSCLTFSAPQTQSTFGE